MKKSIHIILLIVTLTIISFGCGSKGVNLKAKEKEIQAFFDSTKFLKYTIDIHYSKSNKKGIVVYLNGSGGSHDEIYDTEAKENVASYLAYRFFWDELIEKDESLVFQFTHSQSPIDATWYEFGESERESSFHYYENNQCFYKQMEYMIKTVDPENYNMFNVFLERTDAELASIKPSYKYKPYVSTFFTTLYNATYYTSVEMDTTHGIPELVPIDNLEVIRILLLQKMLRDNNGGNQVEVLNEVYKIGNIKPKYQLGELLIAFITKDSLGTLENGMVEPPQ